MKESMPSRLGDIIAGLRTDLGRDATGERMKCRILNCECEHRICDAGWVYDESHHVAPCKACYPGKFHIWKTSRGRLEMTRRLQSQEKEKLPGVTRSRSWV